MEGREEGKGGKVVASSTGDSDDVAEAKNIQGCGGWQRSERQRSVHGWGLFRQCSGPGA